MAGDGTIGKACDVLDQVAAFGRPVRFAELLDESAFPKATLYRFLQSLTNQGMLSYDPERQTYTPGMRLVRLAHAAWTQSSLAPIARPFLDALSRETGETVHLAQLDSSQVLYVDKRNATQPVEMYSQAGKVGPAYCTGVGKAMMAYLDQDALDKAVSQQSYHRFTDKTLASESALRADLDLIRQRGFAVDDEEHEPGIICVACPILTSGNRMLGAISVTGSTERMDFKQLEAWVPRVRRVAEQIGVEAQAWRFPETRTNVGNDRMQAT
ncbi:IclR family transcriptional regulator [Ruegeria sp. ANG-S4]|uniref:IclR family transcriptional regulator n=1 Tax=Ruegeria sp. ANG-S4 TaxID=1577904 RepID=UPI00057DFEFA|nr:IclR family transcriptional regulator [Ruegeria sp. ANG-S4]KIC46048.1 IclR family transcriptional regulator [Ruegeria sp. ANG-S4]